MADGVRIRREPSAKFIRRQPSPSPCTPTRRFRRRLSLPVLIFRLSYRPDARLRETAMGVGFVTLGQSDGTNAGIRRVYTGSVFPALSGAADAARASGHVVTVRHTDVGRAFDSVRGRRGLVNIRTPDPFGRRSGRRRIQHTSARPGRVPSSGVGSAMRSGVRPVRRRRVSRCSCVVAAST